MNADLLELTAWSRWLDALQEVPRRSSEDVSENSPADSCAPGDDDRGEECDIRRVEMIAEWTTRVVERLWQRIRERLEQSGLAPEMARASAESFKKAADDGIELLTEIRPHISSANLRDLLDDTCLRLDRIRKQTRPLLRCADLPLPEFDAERVRRGEEAIARGDPGVDAEEWLNQLRREASQ